MPPQKRSAESSAEAQTESPAKNAKKESSAEAEKESLMKRPAASAKQAQAKADAKMVSLADAENSEKQAEAQADAKTKSEPITDAETESLMKRPSTSEKQAEAKVDASTESSGKAKRESDIPEEEAEAKAEAKTKSKPKRPSKSGKQAKAKAKPAASKPKLAGKQRAAFAGTLVAEVVEQNVQRFQTTTKTDLREKLQSRTWVTSGACTGTGMAEIVFAGIMAHFKASHECRFLCEVEGAKQAFLAKMMLNFGGADTHIFENLSQLHAGMAQCCAPHVADKIVKMCPVGGNADFFTCGFSCKDLSPLSNTFSREDKPNILTKALFLFYSLQDTARL